MIFYCRYSRHSEKNPKNVVACSLSQLWNELRSPSGKSTPASPIFRVSKTGTQVRVIFVWHQVCICLCCNRCMHGKLKLRVYTSSIHLSLGKSSLSATASHTQPLLRKKRERVWSKGSHVATCPHAAYSAVQSDCWKLVTWQQWNACPYGYSI